MSTDTAALVTFAQVQVGQEVFNTQRLKHILVRVAVKSNQQIPRRIKRRKKNTAEGKTECIFSSLSLSLFPALRLMHLLSEDQQG